MHSGQCACRVVKFELDINPSFLAVCACLDCKKASAGEAAISIGVLIRWSRLLALQEVLGIHPSGVAGIEHRARFRLFLKPVTMIKRLCRRVDQRPFVQSSMLDQPAILLP
ncbi:GFA family protein [Rhizobium sp. AG207R]|uniref:GFA family protein n=1 Tax=Rhizobium sp. AG207R TaxID=2802287 RepID=UPI003FA69675